MFDEEAIRSIEKGPKLFHNIKNVRLFRRRSSRTGILVSGSAKLSAEGIHCKSMTHSNSTCNQKSFFIMAVMGRFTEDPCALNI